MVYGFFNKGICLVEVTDKIKNNFEELYHGMGGLRFPFLLHIFRDKILDIVGAVASPPIYPYRIPVTASILKAFRDG